MIIEVTAFKGNAVTSSYKKLPLAPSPQTALALSDFSVLLSTLQISEHMF